DEGGEDEAARGTTASALDQGAPILAEPAPSPQAAARFRPGGEQVLAPCASQPPDGGQPTAQDGEEGQYIPLAPGKQGHDPVSPLSVLTIVAVALWRCHGPRSRLVRSAHGRMNRSLFSSARRCKECGCAWVMVSVL